jgi:hypothetical protein
MDFDTEVEIVTAVRKKMEEEFSHLDIETSAELKRIVIANKRREIIQRGSARAYGLMIGSSGVLMVLLLVFAEVSGFIVLSVGMVALAFILKSFIYRTAMVVMGNQNNTDLYLNSLQQQITESEQQKSASSDEPSI